MEFWDFGQVAMNAIIFWIFLKLFVKMRLAISYAGIYIYFVFFGPTDQKLWIF